MKANELMTGDWVLAEGKPVQVTNISILGGDIICVMNQFMSYDTVYASNIVALSKGAKDINMIEPIPLTSEILEKNGFKKYPYKNNYWYCDEMRELFVKIVCIFPIKDRKIYSLLSTAAPRLTAGEDDVYIRCDYVHELQHVLSLCGIPKEIIL